MKNSKWFLTASLAAVIAFTSLNLVASANDAQESAADSANPPMMQMQQNREAVQAAVESGDYNAFAEVAPDFLLEKINADNFARFQEMHNHLEQARAIGEELGLERGFGMPGKHGRLNADMQQNRTKVREAIESGDYNAWAEVAPEKMLEYIDEGNFSLYLEMHEAIQNGDTDRAEEIRNELGLPERPGIGQGNVENLDQKGQRGQFQNAQ